MLPYPIGNVGNCGFLVIRLLYGQENVVRGTGEVVLVKIVADDLAEAVYGSIALSRSAVRCADGEGIGKKEMFVKEWLE